MLKPRPPCPQTEINRLKRVGKSIPLDLLEKQRAYDLESSRRRRAIKKLHSKIWPRKKTSWEFDYMIKLEHYFLVRGK